MCNLCVPHTTPRIILDTGKTIIINWITSHVSVVSSEVTGTIAKQGNQEAVVTAGTSGTGTKQIQAERKMMLHEREGGMAPIY